MEILRDVFIKISDILPIIINRTEITDQKIIKALDPSEKTDNYKYYFSIEKIKQTIDNVTNSKYEMYAQEK